MLKNKWMCGNCHDSYVISSRGNTASKYKKQGWVWQYMAKEWAIAFYKSKAWQKCRRAYIGYRQSIDGGMCEVCKERVGYIVHHTVVLTPENINNPDISLNHNLLRYDCKDCHDKEEAHAFIKRSQLLCSFDAEGQPIPPLK